VSDKTTLAGLADPLAILKGFASLRRMTGTYPAGHPMIAQKLAELGDLVNGHVRLSPVLRIDVIRGEVCLDGETSAGEKPSNHQLIRELSTLGIDSIHIHEGVQLEELRTVAEFLWQHRESGKSVAAQLAERDVKHISLGKLLPLDTRWPSAIGSRMTCTLRPKSPPRVDPGSVSGACGAVIRSMVVGLSSTRPFARPRSSSICANR